MIKQEYEVDKWTKEDEQDRKQREGEGEGYRIEYLEQNIYFLQSD